MAAIDKATRGNRYRIKACVLVRRSMPGKFNQRWSGGMKMSINSRAGLSLKALILALFATFLVSSASAQTSRRSDRYSDRLIDIKLSEITLNSIDFRTQKAKMKLSIEIANSILPISIKDFDYRLSLYGLDTISGSQNGEIKLGGRRGSHIELPLEVNLKSIPGVIWSAFSNGGKLKFDLDTAFTLPLIIFERRFDKSLSGEVPLRSLVDAAQIIRARGL
jgi:hypothetical protein